MYGVWMDTLYYYYGDHRCDVYLHTDFNTLDVRFVPSVLNLERIIIPYPPEKGDHP